MNFLTEFDHFMVLTGLVFWSVVATFVMFAIGGCIVAFVGSKFEQFKIKRDYQKWLKTPDGAAWKREFEERKARRAEVQP